jgi:3D-(3,5/4)-trihydroxycyclohexane-1,2-dione acylhydrolase (decyclizing)
VVGAVNRRADPEDYVLTAAGGLPGELNMNWRTAARGTVDIEYGFSCMGYETAGAWGAKMARPDRDVIALVGDGSWLMLNSEVFSTVLTGYKVIYVLCDNGGYAVIDRLQRGQGGRAFNNMLSDVRRMRDVRVDFVKHAEALGAHVELVKDLGDFDEAFARAKQADRTAVLVLRTHPDAWTAGGAWWEVGVPEVSERLSHGAVTPPGVQEGASGVSRWGSEIRSVGEGLTSKMSEVAV